MIRISLDVYAPRTNFILGACLFGGDYKAVARSFLKAEELAALEKPAENPPILKT